MLGVVEVPVQFPGRHLGTVRLCLGPPTVHHPRQQLRVEGVDEDVVVEKGIQGLVQNAGMSSSKAGPGSSARASPSAAATRSPPSSR